MIGKLAALAVLFGATMASAQDGPTPRLQAEALIKATEHAEMFENLSDDDTILVRHKASGLLCRFAPGEAENKIMLFEGSAAGDDVGCNTDVGELYMTVYATLYGPDASLDAIGADAGRAIQNRWNNARPFDGPVVQAHTPPGLKTLFLAFRIGGGEQIGYTHARLATVGEWTFMQRLTSDEAGAPVRDMMIGEPRWTEVLEAAVAHRDGVTSH